MSRLAALALVLVLVLASGVLGSCALTHDGVWQQETLARSTAAADIASYRVQRVAVVPFTGRDVTPERALDLEAALAVELAPRVTFELVQLSASDLAEIPRAEPYRRGWYSASTLLEVSRRFSVDAILIGTVRELSQYPPLRLSTQVELVSCETGQVAWSSSIELDTRDNRVLRGIEAWHAYEHDSHDSPGDEALTMISPAALARFAAREIARSY